MAITRLQVLHAMNTNRAGNSLPCGMAMGYRRQPGSRCQPLYNQVAVSSPSFVPTSLRTSVRRGTNLPGAVSTLVQTDLRRCAGAVVTVALHCIAGQNRERPVTTTPWPKAIGFAQTAAL